MLMRNFEPFHHSKKAGFVRLKLHPPLNIDIIFFHNFFSFFTALESSTTHLKGSMVHHSRVSKTLRLVQVGCAILWCLLVAGPSFGFAALKPVLVSEGVYREYCTPQEIEDGIRICGQQELKLNLIFTIAAVLTNVTALIVGPTLDTFGPRICGIIGAVLIAAACFTLRAAWQITLFDGYIVGYTLLAVGGPFTFISSFQLSNTFPQSSGLILALLTGAFDASSAVFLGYRIAYEKSGGTFHLSDFFTYFLAVPVFIVFLQVFVMPHESYSTMKDLALEAMDVEETFGPSETPTETTETTGLLSSEGQDSYTEGQQPATTKSDRRRDSCHHVEPHLTGDMESISGVWGVLHGVSAIDQLKTPWFYLMTLFTAIQMLRINYFVATVLSQYTYLLGSYENAVILNSFFDIALPLGGIVAIPFIGLVLDNFSTLTVLSILLAITSLIGSFGLIPNSFTAAYLNVCFLVVYRPFYYTAVSDYAAKVFGFETFGRVYGVMICISGICNLFQATLDRATHKVFDGNPIPINICLLSATIIIGVIFLTFIRTRIQHIKRMQLENEAQRAPITPMP